MPIRENCASRKFGAIQINFIRRRTCYENSEEYESEVEEEGREGSICKERIDLLNIEQKRITFYFILQ